MMRHHLTTLEHAPTMVDRAPSFVHLKRTASILMKANDLAWSPNASLDDYLSRRDRNGLDLVLTFEGSRSVGVGVCVNQPLRQGDEVGVTYGHDYWVD